MVPTWTWVAWAVVSATVFVVLETIALTNTRIGDTLSENIRGWLGIYPARPIRRVAVPAFVAVFIGFLVWFLPHIVLGFL